MGTQEVPSGMRKNLITLRMTEQWNRLSRETVKYLSLEIFTAQLDAFRCHREPGKKSLIAKTSSESVARDVYLQQEIDEIGVKSAAQRAEGKD